jgi:hypothetical protein
MKKILVFGSFALVAMLIMINTSCETDLTKIDKKPAESALAVMTTFSNIIMVIDDGMVPDSTGKGGMKIMGEPYTETITGDFPNKTYTWDFGGDGDYQGILELVMTDEYMNPGATITGSFQNFIYKGKPVSGNFTFENLGKNPDQMDEYDFKLDHVKVGDNELTANWNLQRSEGGTTPLQTDDVFMISQVDAAAEGVTDEGESFTLDITEGLVLDLTCEYIITKGIFKVVTSKATLTADFGTGECDNLVKTSNGVVKVDMFF